MTASFPFALIVPNQPPIANFNCDNNIFHVDLPNPASIESVCLTLIQPLPPNNVLVLSASVYPYTSMQHIGGITNEHPSEIFGTGFYLKKQFAQAKEIKLCLQVKNLSEASSIQIQTDGKKQYSKMVAQNLYNYMIGYNQSGLLINGVGDHLVIPADCLNKWLNLFQAKYKKDPNFIIKEHQQF